MPDASQLIETKTKAFAKALTATLEKARTVVLKDLMKKEKIDQKVAEKRLHAISFTMSGNTVALSRTPVQQAEQVAKGSSWTCASSHMVDKARHVMMKVAPAGRSAAASWDLKKAFGAKEPFFMTEAEFLSAWGKEMSAQGLKNYKGKDGYGSGDGFHLELPDGRPIRSDSAVQACMIQYAKLTRIDGGKPNAKFERDWKADLKPHIEKAEKDAAAKK